MRTAGILLSPVNTCKKNKMLSVFLFLLFANGFEGGVLFFPVSVCFSCVTKCCEAQPPKCVEESTKRKLLKTSKLCRYEIDVVQFCLKFVVYIVYIILKTSRLNGLKIHYCMRCNQFMIVSYNFYEIDSLI